VRVREPSASPGCGGIAPVASACRWESCGSVVAPSTLSTDGLPRSRRRRNNAPAACGAGRPSRNASANTADSEDGEHDTWPREAFGGVAFSEEKKDLDRGSWEQPSP